MLLLSRSETEALLDPDDLRRAVAAAMVEVSAGRASMPSRIAARIEERDAMLAAMPAYLPGIGGLAAKLVSLFPGNAGTPVPTHQAMVLVFDPHTGSPVALMDGTSITAQRTAAGSALATALLSREDVRILAILGTGVQARAHVRAVTRVRDFEEIRVAGRDPAKVRALAVELAESLGLEVTAAAHYQDACDGADVICATTHSPEPVVCGGYVGDGAHVTSVGYNVAGREVDSEVVGQAIVVVESRAAVLAPPPSGSNDIRVPMEEGALGEDRIIEIGEIIAGERSGRTGPHQITLYKSVGVAAQDVAAATLVLQCARARGLGTEIPL